MVMIKRDAAVTANGIKLVGRKLELPARLPQRAHERKIRKKGYARWPDNRLPAPADQKGRCARQETPCRKEAICGQKFRKGAVLHVLPRDAVNPCEQDTPLRGTPCRQLLRTFANPTAQALSGDNRRFQNPERHIRIGHRVFPKQKRRGNPRLFSQGPCQDIQLQLLKPVPGGMSPARLFSWKGSARLS